MHTPGAVVSFSNFCLVLLKVIVLSLAEPEQAFDGLFFKVGSQITVLYQLPRPFSFEKHQPPQKKENGRKSRELLGSSL